MKSVLLYMDEGLYEQLKIYSKNKALSIVTAINRIVQSKLLNEDKENSKGEV